MKAVFMFIITLFLGYGFSPLKALDKQEKKAEARVTLVTIEWEPFVGEKLPNQGLIATIVKKALDNESIAIEKIAFRPWLRALTEAAQGKYTGLLSAYRTPEREKLFIYSDPIFISSLTMIAKKDCPIKQINKIEDLNPYKIGMVKGYDYPAEIKKAKLLNVEFSINDQQNLKLMKNNQIQIAIMDKDHFEFHADQEMLDNTRIFGTPLEHKTLHLIASRALPKSQELIKAFNKGLKKLKDSGELDKIYIDYKNTLIKIKKDKN